MSKWHDAVRFVEVGAYRLRVRIRGRGQALLLLNGIGGALELWDALLVQLSGFRTIALDAPGTGESTVPAAPLSMAGMARIVTGALDELGLEQVDVLGLSFGGALAQQLAYTAPQRVQRMVLASTTCGLGSPLARPGALLALATPLRYYSQRYHERSAPGLYGGRVRREGLSVAEPPGVRAAHPPDAWGYASHLTAIAGWSSLPWLHRLDHPTLVLVGDDDPVVPVATAELLASRLPNGRLHVVPGGGHLLLLDSADVAAPLIRDHLRDRWSLSGLVARVRTFLAR